MSSASEKQIILAGSSGEYGTVPKLSKSPTRLVVRLPPTPLNSTVMLDSRKLFSRAEFWNKLPEAHVSKSTSVSARTPLEAAARISSETIMETN